LLYNGYVGFGVVFALAIAGLLGGRLDAAWAAATRRWALLAWGFLTLGITVGSAWAYYELGWGGWWFWDPVENASLMPWLVGTALLHSLAATARRDVLGAWSALLAILVFSLSLMGTFLVRSGVLTSVHAFAADPERGVFMLAFLGIVVGGSFALFAVRAPGAAAPIGFAPGSRESLLLANNVLLLVAAGTVLLGTLYPLALETLKLARLSVGPPYFEATFVPLAIPLLLLAGVGPLVRWGPAARGTRAGARPMIAVALCALLGGLALPLAADDWRPLTGLGLALALWVVGATGLTVWRHLRRRATRTRPPRRFWGMVLAHAGIAVFVAGATLVRSYETWDDRRLAPGESTTVAGRTVRFEGTEAVSGPNYESERGRFEVLRGDRPVTTLHPEKRRYTLSPTPMTEAAIHTGPLGDLYLSLGEPVGRDGAWLVRIAWKPFVAWIWVGWLLMALGALLAWSGRDARRSEPA
jgi:cytochrome c-type biogenesis protein CcmF